MPRDGGRRKPYTVTVTVNAATTSCVRPHQNPPKSLRIKLRLFPRPVSGARPPKDPSLPQHVARPARESRSIWNILAEEQDGKCVGKVEGLRNETGARSSRAWTTLELWDDRTGNSAFWGGVDVRRRCKWCRERYEITKRERRRGILCGGVTHSMSLHCCRGHGAPSGAGLGVHLCRRAGSMGLERSIVSAGRGAGMETMGLACMG